ncbi:hypothetical protein KKE68_00360, partial [Patescibacteria group bacterium]|nr:hypothetical protein [Patescibacteria group bacterium]
ENIPLLSISRSYPLQIYLYLINPTSQLIKRLEDKLDETKILRKQVDELRSRLDKVEVDLQRVRARN